MKKFCLLLLMTVVLAGCGTVGPDSPEPNPGPTGEVTAKPHVGVPGVDVVDNGFGQRDDRVFAVAVLRNDGRHLLGEEVEVGVELFDESENSLGVKTENVEFSWDGQELLVPVEFGPRDFDNWVQVVGMEVTVSAAAGGSGMHDLMPMGSVESIRIDQKKSGTYAAVFEIGNGYLESSGEQPFDETVLEEGFEIPDAELVVVCRDEDGSINGGSAVPFASMKRNKDADVVQPVVTTGKPALCRAFTQYVF